MEENEFQDLVQAFTAVDPGQARQLLEKQDGAILFIGRETCPYCRRFLPKLAAVATAQNWTVYFLNSQGSDYVPEEIAALRSDYHVPTVPALLYASKDDIKVRCDSSMTEEEIAAFVA